MFQIESDWQLSLYLRESEGEQRSEVNITGCRVTPKKCKLFEYHQLCVEVSVLGRPLSVMQVLYIY